jgi:hypothetical protein
MQAEECRRLLALPQSEASARLLTNLSRTWVMIANQIDRYVEIVKKEAAQKSKAASVGGFFHIEATCDVAYWHFSDVGGHADDVGSSR